VHWLLDEGDLEFCSSVSDEGELIGVTFDPRDGFFVACEDKRLTRITNGLDLHEELLTFRRADFDIVSYVLATDVFRVPTLKLEQRKDLLLGASPPPQAGSAWQRFRGLTIVLQSSRGNL
jgi:hypothetical protein